MDKQTPRFAGASLPGVVGLAGRYPVDISLPLPLTLAGVGLAMSGPLRIYSCGITPYDVTHVGHASTFTWADLITSVAGATGVETLLCRNVTDVDDVLTAAAHSRGRPFDDLALSQEFLFDRDMKALAVARPSTTPHARRHIGAVQRLAAALLAADAAYQRDGFVYFRGEAVPARAELGDAEALALSTEYGDQRDVPGRESSFDVAVWRPSLDQDPAWPSPWGWGRPGWHAECAAMALACVGNSVDVLVGGADLQFPHHAYLAAMAEAASGVTPFARTSVQVGEVRLDGAKMAKSTGNLVLVSDLLQRHSGAAIRTGLLNRPWGQPWECAESEFDAASIVLEELHAAAGTSSDSAAAAEEVLRLLVTDLGVPAAIDLAREAGGTAARFLLEVLKLRETSL